MTLPNKLTLPSLLEKLTQADICCRDCGEKYGTYSVGCSSTWTAKCPICEEVTGCTEVRDWGYLTKGINELKAWRPAKPFSDLTEGFPPERKARIKEQSKILAEHLATVDPIMNDDELEAALEENKPSYEQGEISCSFSEDEIAALKDMLGFVEEHEEYELDDPCKAAINKVFDLYDDHCVKYGLSPALQAYYEKYGEYGTGEYQLRWEGFRDAFLVLNGGEE
jgi:hypothetical protein